jgi:hypothetical protein
MNKKFAEGSSEAWHDKHASSIPELDPRAVHHVISRGNNRQAIFLDDGDRTHFLALLAKAVQKNTNAGFP